MKFIHMLNDTAITYVTDIREWGWEWQPDMPIDGWEVISHYGEIQCFSTWESANEWRIQEIKESLERKRQ